jgi:hypothetical protein
VYVMVEHLESTGAVPVSSSTDQSAVVSDRSTGVVTLASE